MCLWRLKLNCFEIRVGYGAVQTATVAPMKFSLYLFGACADRSGSAYYEFALKAAELADKFALHAVWIPERHFHPFGGYFPNPSVVAAAVAARTNAIGIRAGSVNLPIHDPLRVAEEWAVVDQLSGGRVGISAASGWNDRDFVLAPESFARRREVLAENLEIVRRLWNGRSIRRRLPNGQTTEIEAYPKPCQSRIPVWLTAAGTRQTFENAGGWDCHVLTHLIGQSIADVGARIRTYRNAREAAGLPSAGGTVTLMLHTFLGESKATMWEQVREPLEGYVATSIGLLGSADTPWSSGALRHRPAGAGEPDGREDRAGLEEQRQDVARHAARRYFDQSGLFGSLDEAREKVAEAVAAGVDEIACLIDFGLPLEAVLAGIRNISDLNESWQRRSLTRSVPSVSRRGTPLTSADIKALPPQQQRAVEIWRDALGVEELSLEDDFFALGGNSLEAMRVMRQLADADAGVQNLVFLEPILRDFLAALPADGGGSIDDLAARLEQLDPGKIKSLLKQSGAE